MEMYYVRVELIIFKNLQVGVYSPLHKFTPYLHKINLF